MTEKHLRYYESMSISLSIYVIFMIYTIFNILLYTEIALYLKLLVLPFLVVPYFIVKKDSERRMKMALYLEQITDYALFDYFRNVFEKKKKPKKRFF